MARHEFLLRSILLGCIVCCSLFGCGGGGGGGSDEATPAAPPVISGIYNIGLDSSAQRGPAEISAGGGSLIEIEGQNFQAGAQVYFGTVAATNVQVASANRITCTAPSGVTNGTRVVVVNPDGQSSE